MFIDLSWFHFVKLIINWLESLIVTHHGSHIFGLTNFPDFCTICFHFPVFLVFYFMKLTNAKIYLTNTFQLKITEKYKNNKWLNSLTFPVS